MKYLFWSVLCALLTILSVYIFVKDYQVVSALIRSGATGELQVQTAQKVERGRRSSSFTYSVSIIYRHGAVDNLTIRRSNALSVGYAYPIFFDLDAARNASLEKAIFPEESYRIAKVGMSVLDVMQLTTGPLLFWAYPIFVALMGFSSLILFRSYKRGEA